MSDSRTSENSRQFRRASPTHRGALDAVFGEVKATIPGFFADLFDKADEMLFDRADNAGNLNDQRIHFDAMRLLRTHRDLVTEKTLRTCFRMFEALLKNDLSLQLVKPASGKSDLELVENNVLEEMIALDNIVSAAVAASGEELDFITRRLAYLQGHAIDREDNPFIPESLCEALSSGLTALDMDAGPKRALFGLLHRELEKFWPGLVFTCNRLLRETGVLPDLEKQKRTIVKEDQPAPERPRKPAEDREKTTSAGARESPGPEGYGLRPEAGRLTEELMDLCRTMRAVFGDLEQGSDGEPGQLPLSEVVQTLTETRDQLTDGAFLQQMREQGLEQTLTDLLRDKHVDIGNLSVEEQGLIRVLDRAFGKLNGTRLVPGELSTLVLQLQVPIAAMALEDAQFLSQEQHPGRRLINEIFKVSTTFLDGAEANKDPLRQEVDRVVDRLQGLRLSSRDLAGMLSDFIDYVEKDKKRLYMREQRLLEEEEALARVSITHGKVYALFMEQLEGLTVPRFFRKFCEDAWSKTVFLSLLRNGDDEGAGKREMAHLKAMSGLVAGSGDGAKAAWERLRPEISGDLEGINLEPAAISRWIGLFDRYFNGGEGDSTSRKDAFDPVRLEDLDLSLPGVAYIDPPEEKVDVRALETVDALRQGVWVEFRATEDSETVRCRLAGVVKPLSKFVFTNRRGKKVVEETRSRLASKLRSGEVSPLDNSGLFDSAFEDVVSEIQARADTGSGAQRLH